MNANLRLLIAIPSYSRPNECKKHFTFWSNYNDDNTDVIYFVEPRQYKEYKKAIPFAKIIKTKDNCLLNGQKLAIKNYAIKNKYIWVLKLDDDVSYFSSRGKRFEGRDEIIKLKIYRLLNSLKENIGALSIPYRNELYDNIYGVAVSKNNAKLQSSYFIRPLLIETKYNYVEDFAQSCFVIKNGYKCPRTGLFGQALSIRVAQPNSGGFANNNRKLLTTTETLKLISEYKNISYKDDPDLGLTPIISKYINPRK